MIHSLEGLEDIGGGQRRENEGLDGAREDAECHDGQRDHEGHEEGEHRHRQLICQDIAEEPEAQAERLRKVLEDVDGQQDRGGLHIAGKVAEALLEEA
eukprot:CAMPEP_0115616908 /NCGR_PEP_ID=MMETSP0272-20121206/23378_1 /TAXON_ID=71861 /ORGANISM="Scrippsiella trochoidea, Strain CCMP3099" /LENGTH=97 /DNA_ID=CAMNT_0003052861 /DNA_START=242 /DNA_END=532 /DNA_ORIENTATION=+